MSEAIDFAAHHLPSLASGTYLIDARHDLATADGTTIAGVQFTAPTHHLFIAGPRFGLNPQMVGGVFPPRGSLGDHTAVLPHVLLRPSVIPWQRHVTAPRPNDTAAVQDRIKATPWLALILFDADETPAAAVIRAAAVKTPSAAFPSLPDEPGDGANDLVTVIDVPAGTLLRLLPHPDELPHFAHVRERTAKEPTAVVVGNRLPPPGSTVTVHLVSLEGRIERVTDDDWQYEFRDLDATAPVRLVSLLQWSFTCASPVHGFHGLAAGLDRSPSTIRLRGEDGLRARVSVDESGRVVVTDEQGWVEASSVPTGLSVVHDNGNSQFGPALFFGGDAANAVRIERPFVDRTAFTIAVWLKPQSVQPAAPRSIFGPSDPSTGTPALWQDGGTGRLRYGCGEQGGGSHGGMIRSAFADADTWVHVAWVKSAEAERLYVNGRVRATSDVNQPLPMSTTGDSLWVGGGAIGSTAWDGLLADFRVYGRSLSEAEIHGLLRADRTHQPELAGFFTSRGLVPLEHRLRQGRRTVSWYGGPLRPDGFRMPTDRGDRPDHADGYLEYYADVDMFDTSYAAAWELGRQLLLQNRAVAVELSGWVRSRRHDAHRAAQARQAPHLPSKAATVGEDGPAPALPPVVRQFLDALALLDGVPANYLIPDGRLLPPESLRFFQVDGRWIDALTAGALSLAGYPTDATTAPSPGSAVGGLLLRSELVSGWPTLVIDGYAERLETADATAAAPLMALRRYEIAKGTLLCLFDESPATVDIHLAPGEVHCGFDAPSMPAAGFSKMVRAADGTQTDRVVVPVPFRSAVAGHYGGVVDIADLVNQMGSILGQPLTTADVAMQLVQGIPKVRFLRATESAG
ncbi:MAG: hypothetical protein QOG64_1512 [Acidimicrobiaceae bacterium]|nr:hypothetical protein [Acidimicrobiaceae bacterium]